MEANMPTSTATEALKMYKHEAVLKGLINS